MVDWFFLLLRYLLVLIVTFLNDQDLALSILVWLCLFIGPFVCLLHVYKSATLNFLEISFLSLTALMGFSSTTWQNTAVLAFSILLCAIILLFHLGQRLKATSLVIFVKKKLKERKKQLHINANEGEHPVDREDEPIKRSDVPVTIVGVASLDEIREPLLEDMEPNGSW